MNHDRRYFCGGGGVDVVDLPRTHTSAVVVDFSAMHCSLAAEGSFADNVLVATSSLGEVIVGLCSGHDLGGEWVFGPDHDGWCFGCVDDAQEGVWRFGPRNATALLETFWKLCGLGIVRGISRGVVGLHVGVNHVGIMHLRETFGSVDVCVLSQTVLWCVVSGEVTFIVLCRVITSLVTSVLLWMTFSHRQRSDTVVWLTLGQQPCAAHLC